MSEQILSVAKIRDAAKEFSRAGRDSQAIMKRLEKAVSKLEKEWSGVNQEMFYTHYTEWRNLMQGHVVLLMRIAMEMQALAERYERADS